MNSAHLNVVVTRLQNIGDMLVFIPALRMLRKSLPQSAKITLLAKHAQGIEIVRRCPFIDSIISIQGRGLLEKIRILRELRKLSPDVFIVSPQDQGKVPWAVFGGAKRIAAFKSVVQRGEVKREKMTFMIDVAPEFDTSKTETENSAKLVGCALKSLGIDAPESPDLKLEYSWFLPETPARVAQQLKEAGADPARPLITSAPFSKASQKNWPGERFAALYKALTEKCNAQIALLGGPADAEPAGRIAASLPKKDVLNLAGKLSLDESAWTLKGALLHIGNDSGPSHLAAATGTPAVVFYRKENHSRWHLPDTLAKRIELVAEHNDLNEITLDSALAAALSAVPRR